MTKPYRISDVGRGLKIIDEMARLGHTELTFPRIFSSSVLIRFKPPHYFQENGARIA